MKSIFKFNNLRFSLEMFRHMSVIKDDCWVFLFSCEEVSGVGQTDSTALSSLLMMMIFLFECVPSLAFTTFRFLP